MAELRAPSDLGFEADLFKAADRLRGNLEPSEYKHVVLGLVFLKYISEAFEAHHAKLADDDYADPEDPEEYLAENIFWVPQDARWSHLRNKARDPNIGKIIDDAMEAIERVPANEKLKGVLPKNYARPTLNKEMLGDLIDLFSKINMRGDATEARDLLGRVYEYFLSGFASSEGKRGGEFFTPRSVVKTLVSMLEPKRGRVYDPCCGSGGMFIQSENFIEDHGGRRNDISVYSAERQRNQWKMQSFGSGLEAFEAGCLLAHAETVIKMMPRTLAAIEAACVPWHYLVERQDYAQASLTDVLGPDGSTSRFLVSSADVSAATGSGRSLDSIAVQGFPTLDELNAKDRPERDIEGLVEVGEPEYERRSSEAEYRERGINRLFEIDIRELPERPDPKELPDE